MKKYSALAAGLLAAALLVTASCKKDDEATPAPVPNPTTPTTPAPPAVVDTDTCNYVPDACLITKATYDDYDAAYATFEYDACKRLIKYSYTEDDVSVLTASYTYTDSLITGVTLSSNANQSVGRQTIAYNAKGQWTKITRTSSEAGDVLIQAEYDASGNRTKITYDAAGSEEDYYTTYEYAGGNLVKETEVRADYSAVTTYEYFLDKENKLQKFEGVYGIGEYGTPSKNLVKKRTETMTYPDSEREDTHIYVHTYKFNENGFPTYDETDEETGSDDYNSVAYAYTCQ